MIFSVSERGTFKRCRRKWDLGTDWRQNLQPLSPVPALMLGGLVQEALSNWTEDESIDPVDNFMELSILAIANYKDSYLEKIGAEISDIELGPIYDLVGLGNAMVTNYRDVYKKPLPNHYHKIQTEQRTVVAVPNTEHWECDNCHWCLEYDDEFENRVETILDSSVFDFHKDAVNKCPACQQIEVRWQSHFLRGTFDTLVQNDQGRMFVLERKTYSIRPEPKKLMHDDQQLAYDWILGKLFGRENAGGVLYDGLWKRAVPPPRTKNKVTGLPLTVKDLFYREIFIRPQAEIDEFESLLQIECADMARAHCQNLIYINRPWMGCIDCNMERLCSAMSRGEDADYIREKYYMSRPKGVADLVEEEAE